MTVVFLLGVFVGVCFGGMFGTWYTLDYLVRKGGRSGNKS